MSARASTSVKYTLHDTEVLVRLMMLHSPTTIAEWNGLASVLTTETGVRRTGRSVRRKWSALCAKEETASAASYGAEKLCIDKDSAWVQGLQEQQETHQQLFMNILVLMETQNQLVETLCTELASVRKEHKDAIDKNKRALKGLLRSMPISKGRM